MKLLVVIISNEDSAKVSNALLTEQYFVTKIATTGGLLSNGNTTLLVGTEDNLVSKAIEIISKHSKTRKKQIKEYHSNNLLSGFPFEVNVSGATIFVVNVEQSIKL